MYKYFYAEIKMFNTLKFKKNDKKDLNMPAKPTLIYQKLDEVFLLNISGNMAAFVIFI